MALNWIETMLICATFQEAFELHAAYTSQTQHELAKAIRNYNEFFKYTNPLFYNNTFTFMGFIDNAVFKQVRKQVNTTNISDADNGCQSHIYDPSMLESSTSCPWYQRMNVDKTRIPEIILESVCKCPGCKEGCCTELTINYPVLRLLDQKMVPTLEPIKVACVCQIMQNDEDRIRCANKNRLKQSKTQNSETHQKRAMRRKKKRKKNSVKKSSKRRGRKPFKSRKRKKIRKWRHCKRCFFYYKVCWIY